MHFTKLFLTILSVFIFFPPALQAEIVLLKSRQCENTKFACEYLYPKAVFEVPEGWYSNEELSWEFVEFLLPVGYENEEIAPYHIVIYAVPIFEEYPSLPTLEEYFEQEVRAFDTVHYAETVILPDITNSANTIRFKIIKSQFWSNEAQEIKDREIYQYSIFATGMDKDKAGQKYFVEVELNAKTEQDLEDAIPAFTTMLKSYESNELP